MGTTLRAVLAMERILPTVSLEAIPNDPGDESLPIDNTRLAYLQLRRAILDGTLAPGSWVSQVQLAAKLSISRTPLREALRLLQNEGLVHADFNRRVRVRDLSI